MPCVYNRSLLDHFRQKFRCEVCGRKGAVEPHHVYAKGMGGGAQLDIPENLIALDRFCHNRVHSGQIPRSTLLALIACRQGLTVDQVLERIYSLRRLP